MRRFKYVGGSLLQPFLLATIFVLAFRFLTDDVNATCRTKLLFGRTLDTVLLLTATNESRCIIKGIWDGIDEARQGTKSRDDDLIAHIDLYGRFLSWKKKVIECRNAGGYAPHFIDFPVRLPKVSAYFALEKRKRRYSYTQKQGIEYEA